MADGIFRMTTEEYIEHLQKMREKLLQLRAEGNGAEEAFCEEAGGYWFIEYYKKEMVEWGIIPSKEDW